MTKSATIQLAPGLQLQKVIVKSMNGAPTIKTYTMNFEASNGKRCFLVLQNIGGDLVKSCLQQWAEDQFTKTNGGKP